MKITALKPIDIGRAIKLTRLSQQLDQLSASALSGSGLTFISHVENGKETAQIGKVLNLLAALGIKVELTLPVDENDLDRATAKKLLDSIKNDSKQAHRP